MLNRAKKLCKQVYDCMKTERFNMWFFALVAVFNLVKATYLAVIGQGDLTVFLVAFLAGVIAEQSYRLSKHES